eukprot:m.480637 g.480637  ORF g.480637 m.480637 type:complete len:376 (-) comp21911_c0_seq1:142-1269(-)
MAMATAVAAAGRRAPALARASVPRVASVGVQQKRFSSMPSAIDPRPATLASAGAGGRSSVSGVVATVFGATGFLGRYIVSRLGQIGSQMTIPYRGCELNARHLRVSADLGQVIFADYSVRDEAAINKLVKHSNVVINLIGQDDNSRHFTLEEAHVGAARRIARACANNGVEQLIHFSSLNAHPDSRSQFLKTKALGEEAVREEFPAATIVRPSTIYGLEDRFLNQYAQWASLPLGVPLIDNGSQDKMPVYVRDVAAGVTQIIRLGGAPGQTFEFVGRDVYTNAELVELVFDTIRKPHRAVPVPRPVFELAARVVGLVPLGMSKDRAIRMGIDDATTAGLPTLESLGVDPVRLERQIVGILRRFRSHAHHDEYLEE